MSRIPVSNTTAEMPNIDPGVYEVTCTSVKDDVLENPQYGDGNVIRFYMAFDGMEDNEGEPLELDAIANRKISPKSKLTKWAEALGRTIDFDSEEDFDPEELVGAQCLAKVIRADKDSWPKIDDLTARPKAKGTLKQRLDTDPPTGTAFEVLSAWWAETRSHQLTPAVVIACANDLFGKKPAELSAPERAEVMATLVK